ncbi:MAG: protein-glutamine glutaminase family protein [Candidatus Eremiobacteraeota bacterium]|nr:protein-glutamine glutaminase family protein [Candidatus Eremiobacteraeota bacterium]
MAIIDRNVSETAHLPNLHTSPGKAPEAPPAGEQQKPDTDEKEPGASFSPGKELASEKKQGAKEQDGSLSDFSSTWKSALKPGAAAAPEAALSRGAPEAGEKNAKEAPAQLRQFQADLKKELGPRADVNLQMEGAAMAGKIPTTSELNDLYRQIRDDKSIPWEFLGEGCYARGHVAADRLMKAGVNVGKLFAKVDEKELDNPQSRLKAQNKVSKGSWWYHTAPFVMAKDDATGKVEGYVIDPSMNRERPMKAKEWVDAMWNKKFPIDVDVNHPDVYEPPGKGEPSGPAPFSSERFKSNIEHARLTNGDYTDVLAFEKEKYYKLHPPQ